MQFDNKSALKHYDAIVIGAGISGLTSALILAKEGKKVALFERDSDIAPLLRPYKRLGCECSPGLHISGWMEDNEVLFTYFKYLGVSDGVEKEINKEGYGKVIIGSKEYFIPRGFDKVEAALISYFPDCEEAVKNYLRMVQEVNDQSFYFNHQLEPTKNHGFVELANYTLEDCLRQYHATPELIDLLGKLSYILNGSKANEVPFMVHAFVVCGLFQSPGFFTIKGINQLLSNYKRELKKLGADLFIDNEIEEILIGDNKNAIGIKAQDGTDYYSDMVVASFHPKLLADKIKAPILRPVFKRRLEEAENSFGLYVAFFKIVGGKAIDFHNFIYYDDSLKLAMGTTINHSGLNSQNKTFCVFLVDSDNAIPQDAEEKKVRASEKMKLIENTIYQKIPDIKGKTILLDYLKPWSFERYTKTINGSAYGIKQTLNSLGFQHKVPVKNLYLVGQALYPGFLGSMISGFSLAFELLDSVDYWKKVCKQ